MPINLDRLTLGPAMRLFAVDVRYARPEAIAFTVRGVFDREHAEIFTSAEAAPVSTIRAQLAVRLAAFPAAFAPAQGDEVQVALVAGRAVHWTDPAPAGAELLDYLVQDVRPDAEGGAVLILQDGA